MTSGKPFVCWLGRDHETPLYIGDKVNYELDDGRFVEGKFGHSKKLGYVVRVGKKLYKVWFTFELKALNDGRFNQ